MIYNKIIINKFIFGFLILFQLTFFVGCNQQKLTTEIAEDLKKSTNITLTGIVSLQNRSFISNRFFAFISPAYTSITHNISWCIYNKEIPFDNSGRYSISNLVEENWRILFGIENYDVVITNLDFTPPKTELNFSFPEFKTFKLTGKVINGLDKKPMKGVTVYAKGTNIKAVSDENGSFSFQLKNLCGEIVAEAPGFGHVRQDTYVKRKNKSIVITLWPAGNIKGKVTTIDGKPLSGIIVSVDNILEGEAYAQTNALTDFGVIISNTYVCYESSPSDINGIYIISNVVAPIKYEVDIKDYLPENKGYLTSNSIIIKVEPYETVKNDFIALPPAVLAVKAFDENNNPVLNYIIDYEVWRDAHGYVGCDKVNLSNDSWHYLNYPDYHPGTFSCSAINIQKNLGVETNNIHFSNQKTNFISLYLSDVEINITGSLIETEDSSDFLLDLTDEICYSCKNYPPASTKIDDSDYFIIKGLNVKKGEMINICCYGSLDRLILNTNLPSGSRDVKLRLTKKQKKSLFNLFSVN